MSGADTVQQMFTDTHRDEFYALAVWERVDKIRNRPGIRRSAAKVARWLERFRPQLECQDRLRAQWALERAETAA